MLGNDINALALYTMDGADASTAFPDSSVGGATHDGTAYGDAQIDTAIKKFGTGAALLDANDYVGIVDHADFDFGTNDFAIDFQWYPTSFANPTGGTYQVAFQMNECFLIGLKNDESGKITIYDYVLPGFILTETVLSLTLDAWNHVALTRESGTLRLFTEGVQRTTVSSSRNYNSAALGLKIGGLSTSTDYSIRGSIDEVRISDIYRWNSGFTPPTEAYSIATAILPGMVRKARPINKVPPTAVVW